MEKEIICDELGKFLKSSILAKGVEIENDTPFKDGAKIEQEDLHAYCAERLSIFKVPKRFKFVERLEMTTSGKVVRV